MLLAEKKEYRYNSEYLHEQKAGPNQVSVPESRPRLKMKVMSMVIVIAGFIMASLIVARYAEISENNQKILALKDELKRQYRIQEQLKLQLAFKEDLNYVENEAKNNLGMDYPTSDQIRLVKLPEHQKETIESHIVQGPKKSLWDTIIHLID